MSKKFLVVWWMSQAPHAATFENQASAEAAAHVRNGLLLTLRGTVDSLVDYYRRDEAGNPMPAEWRDLEGQKVLPWIAAPHPRL